MLISYQRKSSVDLQETVKNSINEPIIPIILNKVKRRALQNGAPYPPYSIHGNDGISHKDRVKDDIRTA